MFLSTAHKKVNHFYEREISALIKELNIYIESKSNGNFYSFPYERLSNLIEKVTELTCSELRVKLLNNIKEDIVSRLVQHAPKMKFTLDSLEKLTQSKDNSDIEEIKIATESLKTAFDLYIQSKSGSSYHPFPYTEMYALIDKAKQIEDENSRKKILESINGEIVSRLMQHSPKLYPLVQELNQLIKDIEDKESELTSYSSNSFA